jgi:plasmid stabilization system protein ParE
LIRAREWYESQCAGLGDDFLAAIAETLLRLEIEPRHFPFYYRGFRRALTRRFPYKLFFQIEGERVIIFRILHGAQDHQRELTARKK